MTKHLSLFAAAAVLALSGCSETTSQAPTPTMAANQGTLDPSVSQADLGACQAAVSQKTNNGDVAALSSTFSQANSEVIVGVGPQRAKWRCLVSGGKVAEVMSLTDEGAL